MLTKNFNEDFEFSPWILKFFENYKNLSLNILNQNFGYKTEYHMHTLFAWFTNSELFSFFIKKLKNVYFIRVIVKLINFIVL